MATTKLTNMVNPEVMADMISAELPKKIKFSPFAQIDTTLVGQAGDTITVPKFVYVGEADDLTEGVAMTPVLLTSTTSTATIKEAGKSLEVSGKAINSGYGDPLGEATSQIGMSIADKVDSDCVTALATTTKENDISGEATLNYISYDAIVDTVDLFGEEDDEQKYLFIHPDQKTRLRKDENFVRASDLGDEVIRTGVIGEIAGCQVICSAKVPENAGTYTNIIMKDGALTIYLKESATVEVDGDILSRSVVLAGSEYYVADLKDESKCVKLTCLN